MEVAGHRHQGPSCRPNWSAERAYSCLSIQSSFGEEPSGNQQRLMSLSVDEFLRRFLLHLLPPRFVCISYFGFLANCR